MDEIEEIIEYVKINEVLSAIKNAFSDAMETTATRTKADQIIIGDLLTTTEIEIKKEIKKLSKTT